MPPDGIGTQAFCFQLAHRQRDVFAAQTGVDTLAGEPRPPFTGRSSLPI